jgi:DNA-binding XRE family transcriptional regulator
MDADETRMIGQRLRMIRRRRGLGLAVAAGLGGISKQYLSMLERGERGFNRRGLLEDLAADPAGQPGMILAVRRLCPVSGPGRLCPRVPYHYCHRGRSFG